MPRDGLPSIPTVDQTDPVPAVQVAPSKAASGADLGAKTAGKASKKAPAHRLQPRRKLKSASERSFDWLCLQLQSSPSGERQASGSGPEEPAPGGAQTLGPLSAEESADFNAWFDDCMAARADLRGEIVNMDDDRADWGPSPKQAEVSTQGHPPGLLLLSTGVRQRTAMDEEPASRPAWRRHLQRWLDWAQRRPLLSSFMASSSLVAAAIFLTGAGREDASQDLASTPSMRSEASAKLESRIKQLQMENIVLHRQAVSTADMALVMGKRLEEAGFKGLDEGMAQSISSLKSMPKPELNAQLRQEMAVALGRQGAPAVEASLSSSSPARAGKPPRPPASWQRKATASAPAKSFPAAPNEVAQPASPKSEAPD